MRFAPALLVLVGLMGSNAAAQPVKPAAKNKPNASQDAAVAAIRKLGGRVTIDTKSPDRPMTGVDLSSTRVTDAGLVHLQELPSLEVLDLRVTQVTVTGVKELRAALPKCEIVH